MFFDFQIGFLYIKKYYCTVGAIGNKLIYHKFVTVDR